MLQGVALHGKLRALASKFLQAEARLLTDQLFMKPPQVGSAKPYHQDNYYFGVVESSAIVTCWVALEDADAANGCMRCVTCAYAPARGRGRGNGVARCGAAGRASVFGACVCSRVGVWGAPCPPSPCPRRVRWHGNDAPPGTPCSRARAVTLTGLTKGVSRSTCARTRSTRST